MILLKIPAYSLLAVYLGWIIYLAVMALSRAKKENTLTAWTRTLGYPVLIFGLLLDVVLNAVILSVVFLEPPKEWLMTARLKRHARYTDRPRSLRIVKWFRQFLDPFDPKGKHL